METDLTLQQKLKWQRASDLVTLAVFSPILIPATALVLAASFLELKRNPLYRQKRVGYLGKEFNILKTRTMRDLDDIDETGYLKKRYAKWNQEKQAEFDKKHRIGLVGRFLRKWRLDELPQIFNVLAGSMSLVGPRPHKPEDSINKDYKERQLVRPGLTGEGKLVGFNGVSHDAEGKEDIRYVNVVKASSVSSLQFYRASICFATPLAIMRYRLSPNAYEHKL